MTTGRSYRGEAMRDGDPYENQFMENVTDFLQQTAVKWAAIIAACTALFLFIKKAITVSVRWLRLLGAVPTTLEWVRTELQPNGGGSLRDSVDRIELRQSENEALSWMIYEMMDRPVFRVDKNGETIKLNTAYTRQYGHTLEHVNGDKWHAFVHPDSRDETIKEWGYIIADGREGDLTFRHRDDYYIRVQVWPMESGGWIGFSTKLENDDG